MLMNSCTTVASVPGEAMGSVWRSCRVARNFHGTLRVPFRVTRAPRLGPHLTSSERRGWLVRMLLLRRCARSGLRPAALVAQHSRPGQLRASSNLPILQQGIPGANDKASRGVNQRNAESLGLVRLASVQLKGYLTMHMNDACDDILRSAAQMNIRTSNTIGLPRRTYKYTVQRSPFVDKHSMEQFEKREYNRIIEFYGASCVGPDATAVVHFLRHMERVIIPAHAAARAKVTLFSYERLHPAPRAETPTALSRPEAAAAAAAELGAQLEAVEADIQAQEAKVAVEAEATVDAWGAEAEAKVAGADEAAGAVETGPATGGS